MRTGLSSSQLEPTRCEAEPISAWRRALAGEGLLSRFGYLIVTQLVLITGGIGYWMITTRAVAPRAVGLAAAVVSTSGFLGAVGVVGIGSLMLVEAGTLPGPDARRFVWLGSVIGGGVVLVLSAGALLASPWLGPSMRAIGENRIDATLFVLGAPLLTIGVIVDSAAIGLRRGPAQLKRNTVATVGRLGLVVACLHLWSRDETGLLAAWVVSNGVSLAFSRFFLDLGSPSTKRPERRVIVRRYARSALRHHVLNLAITSVSFFLPLIAALSLDPRRFAFFSVALLVSSTVLLPPALLAMTLFAEAAGDEPALRRHIRRTLPVAFGCCLFVIAVLEPLATRALLLFGPTYAAHGTTLLRLLLLGGFPYVLKDHYVAICRAQNRLSEGAKVVAVATAVEVFGAVLGAVTFGTAGLCGGWVIAAAVESIYFIPAVRHVAARPIPDPETPLGSPVVPSTASVSASAHFLESNLSPERTAT